MKNLFNQSDYDEIIQRINKLGPSTRAQWGKMNAAQMMEHVDRTLKTAYGELKLKRSFMGFLFGKIAIKQLTSEQPWKPNMPTDKNFIVRDQPEFNQTKKMLLSSVQRFANGGAEGVSKDPHPFFGMLTPEQWSRLMWKHLDHHLTQFGV